MPKLKSLLRKFMEITTLQYIIWGENLRKDPIYKKAIKEARQERIKKPSRTEIINYLLSIQREPTAYLEIGVRNPSYNFDLISADEKFGVDPGIEFSDNPVEFKMTSDIFFHNLSQGRVLSADRRFDVVFIDGLHLATQVDRDIHNALRFIKPTGFIVIHDCNPPTHWHARELFDFSLSPAGREWNGTTWKAFLKWRFNPDVFTCCIDTDWGLGIISSTHPIGQCIEPVNEFFEYEELDAHRKEYLNLVSFQTFKSRILTDTN